MITAKGEFTANDVHKQYGISLRVPPYVDKGIATPVRVRRERQILSKGTLGAKLA